MTDDNEKKTSDQGADRDKKRKQDEVLCRVLAESVITQLIRSGCETGQLINFTSEILRNVIERGFAQPDVHAEQPHAFPQRKITEVPYRCACEDGVTVIRGERVRLSPLGEEHKPLLEKWVQDADIQHSLSGALVAELLGELDDPQAAGERKSFIIHDENDCPIGLTCLFNFSQEPPSGEMAKFLGEPAARGKGYARESEILLLGYAFGELGLNRVFIRTAGFNIHNIKLNEKLGLRFEGILRECRMLQGQLVVIVVMSILSREYDALYRLASGDS